MRPVLFLFAAFGIVAADLASKWFVMSRVLNVAEGKTMIEVLPFFNIVTVWNKGISFGMFNRETDYGPVILAVLAVFISILFTVWLFRAHHRLQMTGIAMVIGGAIGNVIDRLRFGAVHDFLDFHAFGYHWPAFNIADSAIVIGVTILVIHSFFFEKHLQERA